MFRLTFIAACVALAASAAVQKKDDWVEPSFCNTNQCPKFEVLEIFSGYELRRYPAATWVNTEYEANSPDEADDKLGEAFNKLFNYIDGQNENSQKIAMTAPVLTDVLPATGPNCNSRFVMSFYLPYDLQDSPPQPSASDVYIQTRPELVVYVKSFTGFATQQDYLDNTIALASEIGDMSLLEYEMYYTAGYDSPFKWWERHNESWLRAKSNTRPVLPEQPDN